MALIKCTECGCAKTFESVNTQQRLAEVPRTDEEEILIGGLYLGDETGFIHVKGHSTSKLYVI